MDIIILPVFILGAIIGSFLNVVALRYNTGRLRDALSAKGRSVCLSCNKTLHWHELIPVFSFLFQKGKCRGCQTKISWQYPVVEVITGAVFSIVYLRATTLGLPLSAQIWADAFFSLLIIISIYDIRHTIIPDGLVYTFAFLALVRLAWLSYTVNLATGMTVISGWDFAAGPLLFLPFLILWLVSRGRWIGLGDGKLALGIGWFLGLSNGISAIVLAFWLGAVVSVILLGISRFHLNMKSEIPFAPFMILATFIVFITHISPMAIVSFFQALF